MTANRFKFRVWDKENKKMIYPDWNGYFKLENDTVITGNGDLFDLENPEIVENYILMQSTGMVDKNNKEIFEGDLIRDENNDLFIVQFNTAYDIQTINQIESWTTNLSIEDEETDFDMINHKIMWYKNYINKKVEVIGNIYKNKELLRE